MDVIITKEEIISNQYWEVNPSLFNGGNFMQRNIGDRIVVLGRTYEVIKNVAPNSCLQCAFKGNKEGCQIASEHGNCMDLMAFKIYKRVEEEKSEVRKQIETIEKEIKTLRLSIKELNNIISIESVNENVLADKLVSINQGISAVGRAELTNVSIDILKSNRDLITHLLEETRSTISENQEILEKNSDRITDLELAKKSFEIVEGIWKE